MADPRWRRVWDLFHDALDRDPSSRPAFLDTACAGDVALREEVVALLAAHDSDPAFLETPPLGAAAGPLHGLEGRRIGPYVIRRVLGEGGMGIVCDAEQQGDVQRRVALKLVRPGMETRELVARFADERRALALMNHPNIATAYKVGVTDEGRPYFAMEFVDGRPITEWCDTSRLTLRERLERAGHGFVGQQALQSRRITGVAPRMAVSCCHDRPLNLCEGGV